MDRPSIFDIAINDITENDVKFSTINAATGVGKSTLLPVKLVKTGVRRKRVMVVAPMIEGVKYMFKRVSRNQVEGVTVDFPVGFAADRKIRYKNHKNSLIRNIHYGTPISEYGEDDTLVFCTLGHFLNLLNDWVKYLQVNESFAPRTLDVFDYIIVDEPHKHSKEVDIAIGILKYLLVTFPDKKVPSVICTSATYNEPKLYTIPASRPFKVDELYIPIGREWTFEQRINAMPRIVYENLKQRSSDPSICVVFLPGMKEIKFVKQQLIASDLLCDIITAHSKTPDEEMDQIFTPNRPDRWKIILGTNIIEQSVTIENVTVVFDSMIEKINVSGPNETVYLKTEFISRDSAEQRTGRLGRVCQGVIIRAMSKEHYDSLPRTIVPELERLPITNELLKVLDMNIDKRFIFGDINNGITRSLSETQGRKLDIALKKLSFLGAIVECGGYYRVTEYGRFLSVTSLNIKSRIFIKKWIEFGYPAYPAVVLAVMVENVDILFQNNNIDFAFKSSVPLATILLPWLKLCSIYGSLNITESQLEKFCQKYNLNFEGMLDAHRKVRESIRELERIGIDMYIWMFDPEEIFVFAKPILDKLYFNYKIIPEGGDLRYVSVNDRIKHKPLYLNRKYLDFNEYRPPERIVSLLNLEINGKSQVMLWYPSNYEVQNTPIVLDIEPEPEFIEFLEQPDNSDFVNEDDNVEQEIATEQEVVVPIADDDNI